MTETNSTKVNCQNCKLSELCLPFGLQQSEVEELVNIIRERRPLHIDDLLYRQGDTCRSLYAIKSGSFRSFIANAEGEEQTMGFYLPGELMGLDSLQYGRFTCTTVALETASVCELPLSNLNELCGKIPSLHSQLMRILGKEIASDHDKIILLGHRSAKERMATFLLMLSQRYAALGFSSTSFNLTMSRLHIANFLGLTIETVSRQLAYLSQQGVISVKQRGIKIHNLSALRTAVNSCTINCTAHAGVPD
ncbi:fumarate/nitrate reduction transcriptional regulator Fnr [Methylomonas sp. MO1]|uniref:fumarate/nitrate reduction transcriptional regulator Fnr n=1 Tax=unclassified Methylomonas TaxID=2608980 RepID=UPI000479F74F|nr:MULTISPECIES: fumarate/nitrate reduction transcriptional regulator Fnr [unclassified Methylomonas]MDT4288981.1 fumarate/nitrate reduction transcriptional regulator Fnr [Methylomonas sp. MO1]